jgi:hypothetical protein
VDRCADGGHADAETGADDLPPADKPVGRTSRQKHAPRFIGERFRRKQRRDRIPLRRGLGGADEQTAGELACGERRRAVNAPLLIDIFREFRAEHLPRVPAPDLRSLVRRQQQS